MKLCKQSRAPGHGPSPKTENLIAVIFGSISKRVNIYALMVKEHITKCNSVPH